MVDPTRAIPTGGAPAGHTVGSLPAHQQILRLRGLLNRQLTSTLIFSAAGFLILASGWLYGLFSWVPQKLPAAVLVDTAHELGRFGLLPLALWIALHALLIVVGAVGFRARAALASLRGGRVFQALPAGVLPGVAIVLYLVGLGCVFLTSVAVAAIGLLVGTSAAVALPDSYDAQLRPQLGIVLLAAAGWLSAGTALLFVSQITNYRGLSTAARIEAHVQAATHRR